MWKGLVGSHGCWGKGVRPPVPGPSGAHLVFSILAQRQPWMTSA